MPPPASTAPPVPAGPATVSGDLACIRCGYNLRSLDAATACPECATPVAHTLHTSLRFSDPQWLRRLLRGAGWVCAATAVLTLTWLFSVQFLIEFFHFAWQDRARQTALWCGVGAAVVGAIVGTWRLATPEPGDREPRTHRRARVLLRIIPGLTAAISAALFWVGSLELLLPFLGSLFLLAWAGPLVLVARLRNLFARLAAPRLRRHAVWVMRLLWACLAGVGLYVTLGLASSTPSFALVADAVTDDVLAWVVYLVVLAALLALLASWAWLFFLLLALRRHLRRALAAERPPAGAEQDARTTGPRPARPARALMAVLVAGVGAGVVALNALPVEREVRPLVTIGPPQPPGTEIDWGWPVPYRTDRPQAPVPTGGVSVLAMLADLLAGGVLVAMTVGLVKDYAARPRRSEGKL